MAIDALKEILKYDLKNEHVVLPPISRANYITTTIGYWCSVDNRCVINIDEVFKEWLSLASTVVEHYNIGSKDYYNPTYNGNSVTLRPYVKDILSINEHILKLL
jgi:hypothetical protein